MASSNAVTDMETQTRFKVKHARQVVDQVVLLRERVERQEKAIETVIAERDRALECCKKQKQLIERLQQKPQVQPSAAKVAAGDSDTYEIHDVLANDTRGKNFGQSVPGESVVRVSSMRSALLRIGGVDVSQLDEASERGREDDAFDASEFQPLVEEKGLAVECKRLTFGVLAIISRVALKLSGKSDDTHLESDGLQTSR